MLKKLLEALLDLLYPPRCMICQRFIEPKEKPVCRACLDRLPEHEGADPQVKYAQRCVATFFYEKDLRERFCASNSKTAIITPISSANGCA